MRTTVCMTKSSFLRQVGFGLAPRQLQPTVQTRLAVLLMRPSVRGLHHLHLCRCTRRRRGKNSMLKFISADASHRERQGIWVQVDSALFPPLSAHFYTRCLSLDFSCHPPLLVRRNEDSNRSRKDRTSAPGSAAVETRDTD